jgi:Flp pilus assembly protein TadG
MQDFPGIAAPPRLQALAGIGYRDVVGQRANVRWPPGGTDGLLRPAAVTKKGQSTVARQRSGSGGTARDRGAAAVEFALLLPVLLLLLFGIIDAGRALNAQITLTQAAREGARLAALGIPDATVVSNTQSAADGLSPVSVTVTDCAPGAGPTSSATVSVSYQFSFVTPIAAIGALFGGSGTSGPLTLTARGVMPCET